MMMETFGQKLRRLRLERKLSQQKLAIRTGIKREYISQLEGGKTGTVTLKTAQALANGLNIEPSWLINENIETKHQETPEQILERFRITLPSSVPIYEDFPFHAGEPVDPVDYIPVVRDQARGKTLEGYIVHGECLEPDIKDGDIIVINRDGQIDNGNIVVCLVNGEMHLARLRKIAEEIYLENNHGRRRLDEAQIAAPVIEVRRRLK